MRSPRCCVTATTLPKLAVEPVSPSALFRIEVAERSCPSAEISTLTELVATGVTIENSTRCERVVAKMLLTGLIDDVTAEISMAQIPVTAPSRNSTRIPYQPTPIHKPCQYNQRIICQHPDPGSSPFPAAMAIPATCAGSSHPATDGLWQIIQGGPVYRASPPLRSSRAPPAFLR